MPALSTYLRNSLREWHRSTIFPADPANVYVGLFTTATGPGTEGTEVTGGAYARIAIAVPAGLTAGANGIWSNAAILQSPIATVAWGTITHIALFDAAAAGNRLGYAPISPARVVNIGQRLQFAIGALVWDASAV